MVESSSLVRGVRSGSGRDRRSSHGDESIGDLATATLGGESGPGIDLENDRTVVVFDHVDASEGQSESLCRVTCDPTDVGDHLLRIVDVLHE